MFDRPPVSACEEALVNGFSSEPSVDEIWIRYIPKPDDKLHVAVFLAISLWDHESRTRLDRIADDYAVRFSLQPYRFIFKHVAAGQVPVSRPARIWQRPGLLYGPNGLTIPRRVT